MLRIVALSAFGSGLGIAACCTGALELGNLDVLAAIQAYLAGGSIGGACAAGLNAVMDW